jgi:hypothetical protein
MKTCVACGNELQDGMCRACNSSQDLKLCPTCGKAMPRDALRCIPCGTYRHRWRRRVQLWSIQATWISAIFALISAAVAGIAYVDEHMSHTKFKVTNSDMEAIHLQVWNSGLRPSMLTGFRLIFDDLPGNPVTLDLAKQDQHGATKFIAGGQQMDVAVNRALNAMQYNDANLQRLLCDPKWTERPVTLQVDVEESIDPWCPWNLFRSHHAREDKVHAGRISDFINSWGNQCTGS